MKLQINTHGAWRNVADFAADRRDAVMAATIQLARALGTNPETTRAVAKFCVVGDDGRRTWIDTLTGVLDRGPGAAP